MKVDLNYDELLLLKLHLPNECKHLNNIALLYEMFEK